MTIPSCIKSPSVYLTSSKWHVINSCCWNDMLEFDRRNACQIQFIFWTNSQIKQKTKKPWKRSYIVLKPALPGWFFFQIPTWCHLPPIFIYSTCKLQLSLQSLAQVADRQILSVLSRWTKNSHLRRLNIYCPNHPPCWSAHFDERHLNWWGQYIYVLAYMFIILV